MMRLEETMPALALVPSEIVKKWQEIADVLAEIMHVPSAVVMRVEPSNSEVFVASHCKPSEAGSLYCETVMKTCQPLLVPDARRDERWKSSPDIKRGMVSYLGVPISWPNGEIFGTICVYDNKSNEYSQLYLRQLLLWRDVLQNDLRTLATLHSQLEQHEEKIRRLVDANIIGIIIWDLEGRILEANDTFLRMGGYDREDLVSGRLNRTDLTPQEWRERDARTVAELKMIGAVQPFEKEYFRKDGSRVPVLIGLAAFGEERDQGVAFVLDLTERKCAEEALRESEAKFRDYAETASDWFWEIGPDYKFTLLTENAFGSDPTPRIGTACWDHALDVETEPEKWRLVRETLDSRKPFRDFVYCSLGGNGSPMYVKASGRPVFDANGEFSGYRGTGTDVTAIMRGQRAEESLRMVEAELAHVSRVTTLGQLTASIAHEINQPIGSARNNARAALNFLDRKPADLAEVREALNCIVGDADRVGGIIDRVRDQIKKAPPRNERFDLNPAIEEVIGLAQSAITENGVSVQTRLKSGMAPVHGDRVQLQQVVLNLILNAVEAMGSVAAGARELLISTEQSLANGTLVAVRDSGPGIDPKHLERVFAAFYTTKSGGMGMGLSICRSIIEAHGGRLWASANLPCGASFQFALPAIANTAS
jgi:PAS domain S-box-containing protein